MHSTARFACALAVVVLCAIAAPSHAATVDLSWDQCVTGANTPIVDRSTTTPGVYTIPLTGKGLAGQVIGTHFVFELRSPGGLPPAWRFDASGCNAGNVQFLTSTVSKSCPTIGGFPNTTVQYVMDPSGQAGTLTVDVLYGGPNELFPASTYSLGRLVLDLSSAVTTGNGPGCEGIELPVCIALVEAEIIPWGGGTTERLDRGQSFVRWNDSGNQTACSGGTLRGFHVDEFTVTCATYDLESYFLELAPPAGGTTLGGPIAVRTESATGDVLFDEIVTRSDLVGEPWTSGSSWLIATDRFGSACPILRDHEAESFLDRNGGRIVLRDARPGGGVLQDLRYGPAETIPSPAPGRSIAIAPGGVYVVANTPAPRNFAGATAPIVCRPITEDRFLVREFAPACFSGSTAGQFVEVESLSDSLWSGQLILDVLDGGGNVIATRAGLFGTGATSSHPGIRSWLVATSQFQGAAGFSPDALWAGFASTQARLFRLRSPLFGVVFEAPLGAPGGAPTPDPGQSVVFELDGSFALSSPTPRNSQGQTPPPTMCFPADTTWVVRTSGIRIAEVMTACNTADPRIRFFELRADRSNQELSRHLKVEVLDLSGTLLSSTSNLFAPLPDGTSWPEGRSWLLGSADAATAFGVAPDGPCPVLPLNGGRIRIFDERLPARMIDDFRYGTGPIIAPPPGSSVQRAVDGTIALASPPEPDNFAGATSSGNACPPAPFAGLRIDEVATRCQYGDARARFIELVATSDTEFQAGLTLTIRNSGGAVIATVPDVLVPIAAGTPWPTGRSWLLGTSEVAAAYGLAPDAECPPLDPLGGTIRLHDAAVPSITIHEMSYGPGGEIATPPPGSSLRRLPLGSFAIGSPPEPVNFAGHTPGTPSCPCPQVTFDWGTVNRTTDAASFDSSAGTSHRVYFDRPSAEIAIKGDRGVTLGDRFVVVGTPSGQEIEIIALFTVQGGAGPGGPCGAVHGCSGGSGGLSWWMDGANGGFGPWTSVNGPFWAVVRVRVGEPFPFYWRLEAHTFSNGLNLGVASFNANFEWANLPAGMHVESCAGYFDDTPVATLPSLVSASIDEGVVHLEWSPLAEGANGLTVERRDEHSEWSSLGAPDADRSRILFEDRSAAPGSRHAYRLRWTDASGSHATEETWVEVPAATAAMAFAARLASGPVVRGPIAFTLQLPSTEEVGVELFDLKGRRLDGTRWQPVAAGAATFEFRPSRPLAPGVYWIRVRQQAEHTTLRAIVLGAVR